MFISLVKMYKAGGFSRIFQEFGNHLYDFIHGVETSKRELGNINNDPNLNDYYPSHKKTVVKSLDCVQNNLDDLSSYSFIDIGCGKGKTLIIAHNYNFKKIIGYEINKNIFKILSDNIRKQKSDRFILHNSDLNYESISNKSVIYFYNSFQESLTKKFFNHLEKSSHLNNIVLIYVNALYSEYLNNPNWDIVYQNNVSTQDINIYIKK